MHEVILRQFGQGLGKMRVFEKGSFEVITLGGITLGKAIYEPGWKWSDHVRTLEGPQTCEVEHLVLVVEGQCAVAMDDGETTIMKPGDFVYVPPGHDSWVVGNEPYVSLHFMGSETYAK